MSAEDEQVAAAADRLAEAARSGIVCAPVSDILGSTDIALAYRVQERLTQWRTDAGARIVGRKIGLTSEAVQTQIGVDRPDFGVLFDDMRFDSDQEIPMSRLLQPKAEAEVAFVLARDIEDPADRAALRAAVDYAVSALEIVDSRVADWRIGITDTVADNASSGVFVLGSQRWSLAQFEPLEVVMQMWRGDELVSTGTGRACLGDPLNALAWLAQTGLEVGAGLKAGDIVLSGALGPMVAVAPGDVFSAEIAPLGRVTARFSKEER